MKMGTAAVVALLALSAPVLAPAASPSDQPAPTAQAVPPSGNVQNFDKNAAQVSENLARMQKQMDEIQKTSDPAERQKLLREHQELMRQTMGMMGQMWPGGTGGCCAPYGGGPHHRGGPMMGWNAMKGNYAGMTPEQVRQHQYMRDQYMGMQQRMMEQMMQQQLNRAVPQQ
ncbi:hypothetical protein N7373_05150 [Achromobacter mucicolens]|uniref:hypothetical protein n=1 Tax=Achromobacter mucicolens TaxID=1389922 RepID=UPI00244D227B|nr:hypothetical protein [Achromobacter mucicolens]MDH0090827.1 hypothetical protein [Achromobacter mucicolens]